jgi:excisionase family DNA binding protein
MPRDENELMPSDGWLTIDGKRYLTTTHAAQYAGLAKETIWGLVQQGRILARRYKGRRWAIDEQSLMFFVANRKARAHRKRGRPRKRRPGPEPRRA